MFQDSRVIRAGADSPRRVQLLIDKWEEFIVELYWAEGYRVLEFWQGRLFDCHRALC